MSNNVYSTYISNNLKKYPDSTPNVEELLFYYITCSQNGGISVGDDIYELSCKVIQRIKDKNIITDDNDPLFSLIRECEELALYGSEITDEEKRFISGVGELYLKIRENSFDTVNKYNCGLAELYDIRNRLLLEGKEIDDITSRMFDYIDMTFIKESSHRISRRTQRFNQDNRKNYYASAPGKKDVEKMLQDIKPYVVPVKRNKAIKRGVESLNQLDTQVYVQAFLMLEYNASFDMVASFIERVCDEERAKIIINELLNYSSKGPEFHEYILREKNIEPKMRKLFAPKTTSPKGRSKESLN